MKTALAHSNCLQALPDLGRKEGHVAFVNAFLFDRSMTVKIRDEFSAPRKVNGGAPQGSILGCFLFCAKIDKLLSVDPLERDHNRSSAPPSPTNSNLSDTSPIRAPSPSFSDTDSHNRIADFFRWIKPRTINDTMDTLQLYKSEIRQILDIDGSETSSPIIMGYIDDLSVVEQMNERLRTTHHTTKRSKSRIHASESCSVFEVLGEQSYNLGIRINPSKTLILCISTAASMDTDSFIQTHGGRVNSGNELKILGFGSTTHPQSACTLPRC